MRTARQLRAEITKAEAKGKTCTFTSTRTQWQDKVASLRRELALQIAWEAAGTPRPEPLETPPTPRRRRRVRQLAMPRQMPPAPVPVLVAPAQRDYSLLLLILYA